MARREQVGIAGVAGFLLLVAALSASSAAAAPAVSTRVYLEKKVLARPVREAVAGAASRLARPECQKVLSDFSDAAGRVLQQNLEALGQSAPGYLELMVFEDGDRAKRCHDRGVMAVTAPSSRVVFVCREFAEQQARRPGRAEAIVIHEALHSLGLAESPQLPGAPSSAEITERVLARCGE